MGAAVLPVRKDLGLGTYAPQAGDYGYANGAFVVAISPALLHMDAGTEPLSILHA